MKSPIFLSIYLLCSALVAEVEKMTAKPATPCSSCEKGTSRLAALQGAQKCPEDCKEICCTGTAITLSIPMISTKQTAAKVAFTINSLDGAKVEESCLNSHCSVIKYDPKKVTKSKLIHELKKVGVEVAGEKLTIGVAGMTCTGCSSKLTDVLFHTPGVIKVESVSHESKSATLIIDPKKTDTGKITQVINETGYKAVPK